MTLFCLLDWIDILYEVKVTCHVYLFIFFVWNGVGRSAGAVSTELKLDKYLT